MLVERGLRIEFVFRKFGLFITISIQMEPAYKRVNHGENADSICQICWNDVEKYFLWSEWHKSCFT
ncbi:hypothetical protein EEL31_15930 [Brevibacillus laterosporus]|uniref:Uncharacterized protein n=1 Tax=Brevibacillus laterosporus TaxID=1465 RepID=A0A518V395_BRELA|nr:hypothetical protein EEL30_03130 [Brevibacillus laterosporus]TPG69830.1 hypothetical protein EEL31_15930 [Brevibacillus laterosporus]